MSKFSQIYSCNFLLEILTPLIGLLITWIFLLEDEYFFNISSVISVLLLLQIHITNSQSCFKDWEIKPSKYGAKFSIVDNGKETIYTCSLLVRNDANGKKYLYDILDIKKINQVSLKEYFQTT